MGGFAKISEKTIKTYWRGLESKYLCWGLRDKG